MLRSVLNDWNYFWTKYCKLPFLAICCSQFPLLIFFTLSWYQKVKITLWESLGNKKKCFEQKDLLMKKWLIVILKGFIIQAIQEQSTIFLIFFFFFSLTAVWMLFPFPYKSICRFWKIDKISLESFHCI